MDSGTSDAHALVEPGPSRAVPAATEPPLKIRWGKTFIALAGVLALLTAGISGALNIFSLGSAAVVWTSLAVFVAVVVGLRTMAVREQAAQRASRRTQRATVSRAGGPAAAAPVEQKETALFDRAEGAEPVPAQKPLTAAELRAAAMRVAAKGTAEAKIAHTQTLAEGDLGLEPWMPVEVPVPGYVIANRALNLEKPLALPKAPKSTGISIKADQAGVGVASEHEGIAVVVEAPELVAKKAAVAEKAAKKAQTAASERGTLALSNLDDVLQRRRA